MIFFYLAAAYLFIVFFLARLIIPHLGFKEKALNEEIPRSMREKIDELNAGTSSKEEFLRLAYNYIGGRFRSERFNTILKFHYLFKPLKELWPMSGYVPCTVSNYFLKIFLVKSGRFRETEIRRRHVFVNFIIHQYLQIKLNNRWLDVDVGERQRGLAIGRHLKYFG